MWTSSTVLALCITHTSRCRISRHLCPFALRTAFPPSLVGRYSHDYCGHSVALGLAPHRRSRVRPRRTSERDVGAPLISLNALIGHRSAPRRLHWPFHKASAGCDVGVRCHADGRYFSSPGDWGSSKFSFRHITRVPQTRQSQHLDLTVAFLACDCPVHLSDPG